VRPGLFRLSPSSSCTPRLQPFAIHPRCHDKIFPLHGQGPLPSNPKILRPKTRRSLNAQRSSADATNLRHLEIPVGRHRTCRTRPYALYSKTTPFNLALCHRTSPHLHRPRRPYAHHRALVYYSVISLSFRTPTTPHHRRRAIAFALPFPSTQLAR